MEKSIQVGAYIVYNSTIDRMQTHFDHYYGKIIKIDNQGIHVKVIILEGTLPERIERIPTCYFQEGGYRVVFEKGLSDMSSKIDTFTAKVIQKEIIADEFQEKIGILQNMIDQIPIIKQKIKKMKSSLKKL